MKCCICGMEIDQENRSEEHIIHNAIGGILKSDVTAHMSCHQTDFFICQETAHICVIYCLGRQITCLPMNYRLTCLDSSMIA